MGDSPPLNRWTADLLGSGGRLAIDPDDFLVDESLPYAASGEGTHLFVRFQKRGLTTPMAIRRLLPDVDPRQVGYAGLKDRHAVTRQWISVEDTTGAIEKALADVEDVEILEKIRHEKKLRRGHVQTNRFTIVLRDVDDVAAGERTFMALKARGVPNYFGPQRFGRYNDNHLRAAKILRGELRPPRNRNERSIIFSAFQSDLFNRLLSLRIERGSFDAALHGDVMKKHGTGGLFVVEDPAAETPRVQALEISPTGPLVGSKTMESTHDARLMELEIESGHVLDAVTKKRLGPGTRRPMRFLLDDDATFEPLDDRTVRLSFALGSGSYATVVLDEIVKPEGVFTRDRPSRGPAAFDTD